MAQAVETIRRLERGSRWGADGVYYPAEEERKVPISKRALRLIGYLVEALEHVFRAEPDVFVGGDQFIYWERGNIRKRVAPDLYVIRGVPKEPPRAVIRLWEEAVPSLVAEISSAGSRVEDRGRKLRLYQNLFRCPEYFIWDDDTEEMLFYRLEEGRYQPQAPDVVGRFYSQLGVWFGPDPEALVRVYGPDGEPVPDFSEAQHRARENADRSDALAAENERLRAELERLRRGRGS